MPKLTDYIRAGMKFGPQVASYYYDKNGACCVNGAAILGCPLIKPATFQTESVNELLGLFPELAAPSSNCPGLELGWSSINLLGAINSANARLSREEVLAWLDTLDLPDHPDYPEPRTERPVVETPFDLFASRDPFGPQTMVIPGCNCPACSQARAMRGDPAPAPRQRIEDAWPYPRRIGRPLSALTYGLVYQPPEPTLVSWETMAPLSAPNADCPPDGERVVMLTLDEVRVVPCDEVNNG